jgi:hypothetical protein
MERGAMYRVFDTILFTLILTLLVLLRLSMLVVAVPFFESKPETLAGVFGDCVK